MGTIVDFFGEESTTSYTKSLSNEAINNRMFLKNLMEKHGFKNLYSEWWHFTL